MRQAAALLAATALCMPAWLAAQAPPFDPGTAPGRVTGRVSTEQGAGLADVSVTVLGSARRQVAFSDLVGRFLLVEVPAGPVEILFERLGYASTVLTVEVQPGATAHVEPTMVAEAIALDPIDVTIGGGPPFLDINGFYRRSQRGFGQQFSRTSLDQLRMLEVADAVRRVAGIRLQHDTRMGNRVMALRPQTRRLGDAGCALTVYVDGARTLDPNVNQVPPDWLAAMEVYVGADTPAQYRTSNNCGAVLLWTKRHR